MTLDKETLKTAVKEVWIRSLTQLQPDVEEALEQARDKETNERAKKYLGIMLDNARIAKENRSVICQDTGVPTFYIRTSLGFPYEGNIREVFEEAIRELTLGEFPMRSMVVDPLTREERGDNTGENIPLLHFELEPDLDYFEIKAVPKGAGCGMWGKLSILPPSAGVAGVKKFVVDAVLHAGSNPCPPIIVGVGIGGTLEETARLATEASSRPVNERNKKTYYADLEEELKNALNLSEIGAMGMGGDTSVLAVNIECSGAHNPWLPIAVNINCWPGRRAVCRIYKDGHVQYL